MKFFNIDLHVSVIEDVDRIFTALGHEVTSINMSEYNWVFGRPRAAGYGPITAENWASISSEHFYNSCHERLSGFDGFIVTYPPALSKIYERFNKPTIVYIPIRYEYPFYNNPSQWMDLNNFFRHVHDSRRYVFVVNSAYDREYFSYFTGIKPIYIQNICEYVPVTYEPTQRTALIMDNRSSALTRDCVAAVHNLRPVRELYPRYQYNDLIKHRALVHFPYNASIMSFFEHYMMCIPILMPSQQFFLDLNDRYGVLKELTWNGRFGGPSRSVIRGVRQDMPDPNDYANPTAIKTWMQFYDFYQFDHIIYFDSFDDLKHKLESTDMKQISAKMYATNVHRRQMVYDQWRSVLESMELC